MATYMWLTTVTHRLVHNLAVDSVPILLEMLAEDCIRWSLLVMRNRQRENISLIFRQISLHFQFSEIFRRAWVDEWITTLHRVLHWFFQIRMLTLTQFCINKYSTTVTETACELGLPNTNPNEIILRQKINQSMEMLQLAGYKWLQLAATITAGGTWLKPFITGMNSNLWPSTECDNDSSDLMCVKSHA